VPLAVHQSVQGTSLDREENVVKRSYEAPMLVQLGSFRKLTGLLQRHGNDRLILSKN